MRHILKHIAHAVVAAGVGGAVPCWLAGYPKLSLAFGVVGLIAHGILYEPPKGGRRGY